MNQSHKLPAPAEAEVDAPAPTPDATVAARESDVVAVLRRHPWLCGCIVALKKLRTNVALGIFLLCLALAVWHRDAPRNPAELNGWVILAYILIVSGLAVRFSAQAYIRKKEALATGGIYALCRHPLYLGSILWTYGFCVLLRCPRNYLLATAYFAVFYPLAIIWEEVRLRERYGAEHVEYAGQVPLLVPWGLLRRMLRGRSGSGAEICWRRGFGSGAGLLIGATLVLLMVIAMMTRAWRPG